VHLPGEYSAKLDLHAAHGTFLRYMATDKNIYYINHHTKKVKIMTHVVFNEANYATTSKDISPAFLVLQLAGYQLKDHDNPADISMDLLSVKLLTDHGKLSL